MELNGNRISIHIIGGRSGDGALSLPAKFRKDIVNVFYEADKDCLAQIKERNPECQILPHCLSDTCKLTPFNIKYDLYTSSMYRMNPDYESYYTFLEDHDYIISEVTKVVETRNVESVSIDSLSQSPDFLSVDTQGSEYDILLGTKETLKSSVVGLLVESVFHPLYERKIIFGDLVKLLSEQGFHFARFLSMHEASPFRAPLGLRGTGFHMATDCLFLRKIENTDDALMLRKLAFISIIFNQIEYAIECLKKSKGFLSEEPVYLKFLKELEQSVEKMPSVYPDTFVSLYPSFEASKSRFGGTVQPKQKPKRQGMDEKIQVQGWTDVEMVFNRYGLEGQANLLRQNRVSQLRSINR